MRLWVIPLLATLMLWSLPSRGQSTDGVAVLGIQSSQLSASEVGPIEQTLEASVRRGAAAAVDREAVANALRSNPAVAAGCREAASASRAGANALDRLDLARASTQLDRATQLYQGCYGEWLEPARLAEVHILQARLAYTQREPERMYTAFRAALVTMPRKALDPAQFAPDAIGVFDRARSDAAAAPMGPPDGTPLAKLAEKAGKRWVVVGEARRQGTTTLILISLVDRDATVRSNRVRIDAGDDPGPAMDDAVSRLFHAAGIPAPMSVVGSNSLVPTPTPTRRDPRPGGAKPWYRRWYTVAAVGAFVTGIAVAGTVAATNSGGPGNQPTPTPTDEPDSGVTIIIGVP